MEDKKKPEKTEDEKENPYLYMGARKVDLEKSRKDAILPEILKVGEEQEGGKERAADSIYDIKQKIESRGVSGNLCECEEIRPLSDFAKKYGLNQTEIDTLLHYAVDNKMSTEVLGRTLASAKVKGVEPQLFMKTIAYATENELKPTTVEDLIRKSEVLEATVESNLVVISQSEMNGYGTDDVPNQASDFFDVTESKDPLIYARALGIEDAYIFTVLTKLGDAPKYAKFAFKILEECKFPEARGIDKSRLISAMCLAHKREGNPGESLNGDDVPEFVEAVKAIYENSSIDTVRTAEAAIGLHKWDAGELREYI